MNDSTPIELYSNYLKEKKGVVKPPKSGSAWENFNPLVVLKLQQAEADGGSSTGVHSHDSNMSRLSEIEYVTVAPNPRPEVKLHSSSLKECFIDLDLIKGQLAGFNSKWQPPLSIIDEIDSSEESSMEEMPEEQKMIKKMTRQSTVANKPPNKQKTDKGKVNSDDSFEELSNYLDLAEKRSDKKKLSLVLKAELKGNQSSPQVKSKTGKFDNLEGVRQVSENIRISSGLGSKKSILNPTKTMTLSGFDSSSRIDEENIELRLPWYLINPFGTPWKVWEYLTTLLLIYVMIFTPFKIAFIDDDVYPVWDLIDQCINYVYMLDIVLKFFLPIFDDDHEWRISLWDIAKNYLKLWFWIDLVSVFPLDQIINQGNILILIRLSRINKLYRLFKIAKLVRAARAVRSQNNFWGYMLELLRLNPSVVRIGVNIFAIMLFCHIFACLWYFIASSGQDQNSWVIRLGLEDADLIDLYITSLYWITQTVITVGYGDVPAFTVAERLIAIVAMFAGVIFFSLTVGTLTSLLSEMDKKNSEYENKLTVLTQIKEEYKISKETYDRIRLALKYGVFKGHEDFEELLVCIPEKQANELAKIIYKPKISNIDFFDKQPDEMIRMIGPHLKELAFEKGDKIYMKGDYAIEMFFVQSGSVSLVIPHHNNQVCMTVKQGGYFGEIELIYGTTRYFNFMADTHVNLLSLDKKEFVRIFFHEFLNVGTSMKEEADDKLNRQRSVYNTVCEIIATHINDQAKLTELGRNLKDILDPNKKVGSEGKFIRRAKSRGSLNSVNKTNVSTTTTKKESVLDHVDKLEKATKDGDNRIKVLEEKMKKVLQLLGIDKPTMAELTEQDLSSKCSY